MVFEYRDEVSAITAFAGASLSFLSCLSMVLSVYYYPRKHNSYHLQLVSRLLMSDMGLSACIMIYFILQIPLSSGQLRSFCKIYLPAVVYFFLASYTWTIFLSLRFLMSKNVGSSQDWRPPFSFKWIWAAPLVLAGADLIVAWSMGGVALAHINSGDINQSCTFDHDHDNGIIMDMMTFQIPMFCAVVVNIGFYAKGLCALHNAPQSVVSRHLRKASGYVGVLLIVVVPNCIYNMLTIFESSNATHNSLLNLSVILSSLQGFMNVCVYVWSDNNMRQWLMKNFFFWRAASDIGDRYVLENDRSELESQSSSQQNPSSLAGAEASGTSNPISFCAVRDSISGSTSTLVKPGKSILIPKANSNTSAPTGMAVSVDLDHDRFVRFGEVSTRFYSAASTPRTSETPTNFGVDLEKEYNDNFNL